MTYFWGLIRQTSTSWTSQASVRLLTRPHFLKCHSHHASFRLHFNTLCNIWRKNRTLETFFPCKTYSCIYQPIRNISRKEYKFPEILESDLEERFVRGSGPGGQAVAKTNNCCVLKHIPTGMVVRSHDTRSLEENRKIARRRLQEHIDVSLNGENSFIEQEKRENQQKKAAQKGRNKKRQEIKKAFKEKMELEKHSEN